MDKNSTSMRLLLPIAMITLVTILLIVVSVALWTIQNNTQLTQAYLHKEGDLIAEGLANAVATDLLHKDYDELETRLLQSASSQNVYFLSVINTKGQVLSHIVGRIGNIPAHADYTLKHIDPPIGVGDILEINHPDFLSIWHKVKLGTTIGWVQVEIGTNEYTDAIEKMQNRTWQLAIIVAIIGIVLLGAAILHSFRTLSMHETNEQKYRRRLEDKAYYDSLTHLPNRSLLYDRLEQCIARNQRDHKLLTVCFVDLNNFKPINDNYGHDMGDHVLVEVANRLLSAVRGEDTVARQGGDEFIILIGRLNSENEVEMAVERLLYSLNQPMEFEGKTIEIEGSIGYVIYPIDSTDVNSLIELADKSMYRAKSNSDIHVQRYKNT